jgi:hypothetical protein
LRRAEALEPMLRGAPGAFDLRRALRDLFPDWL